MSKSFAGQVRIRSLILVLHRCLAACAGTKVRIDKEIGKYFTSHQWSYPAAEAIAAVKP